jgi:hypothetical protein
VSGGGSAPLRISVWGRELDFASGPLPTQITSQGTGLLVQRPRFLLGAEDPASEIVWEPPKLTRADLRSAEVSSAGSGGGLGVTATTRVEYDGMIRVALRIDAPRQTTLRLFSYELRVPSDVARYFTHHVEYDFARMRVDLRQLSASAGVVGSNRSFPFVPTFSLSNRDVGFEWWCESNALFSAREPIRLERERTAVRLLFTPISRARLLAAGSSWHHEFALFPLPLRPPPDSWRSVRFTGPNEAKQIGARGSMRNVWISFPGQFQSRWHGLPESTRDDEQERLRADLRAAGIAYIPYGKLAAAPALHPVAMDNAERWAASTERWTAPGQEEARYLARDGWRPGTPYGYAPCLGRDGFLDWMLAENLSAFREEALDGVYFDYGSIMSPCVRNVGRTGTNAQTWNYFELRDFYRRLYEEMKAVDPRALITIHSNGQPKALAGFTDFVFVGEALNVRFRQGMSFEAIARNRNLYVPDYAALPAGFLDALVYPRSGGITALLPEIHFAIDAENPARALRFTREFLAIALVNDYPLWWVNGDLKTRIGVARALDLFGSLDGAQRTGWWDLPLPAQPCALRVTSFRKADRRLLIVANLGDGVCTRSLDLGRRADRRWRALDLESRSALPASSEDLVLRVGARDFRLVAVD